ncbi:seven-hairpin glycosidase [Auricularia subglabra TFB-10046 SS5]|nr:seven-hairpin glycosidase [Auricularia subglabra TFB-10046 SS5]
MAPKAVLPVHADDRRSASTPWGRSAACVSRPRNLLITLAVVCMLFFLFASSGPEHRYAGPGSGLLNDIPYLGRPNNGGAGVSYDNSDFEPEYQAHGDGVWGERAREVRDGFLHAYGAYSKVAFGRDEIRPVSNVAVDNFNGWGVSIVDSIDTMVLMGLKNEYEHALAFVARLNLTESRQSVHFFETVIRYLGGFLSAYHLAKEPIFLKKADDLGRILLPAFNTKSGLPQYSAATHPDMQPDTRNSMFLAEIGSCQLEFKYLAHLTGNAQYWKRADAVTRILHKAQPNSGVKGLWGTNWYIDSGDQQGGHYTIGALSDSAYEYLLKQYLLSGRSEKYLLDMYIKATDAMLEHTLYLSPSRNLLYVTDISGSGSSTSGSGKLEHLSCFLPGLFALGADQLSESELDEKRRARHRWAAEGLAYTCWAMYAENRHGLGPEDVSFKTDGAKRWGPVLAEWEGSAAARVPGAKPPGVGENQPLVKAGSKQETDYWRHSDEYLLRPETIESVYLLWRTTKDDVWRERGWVMWEAVERETRVAHGYASTRGLNRDKVSHSDSLPSYFFAETLKYYYLLFSDADPWPLDKFVFNTEAHPLPVFHPREWEAGQFGIDA